MTTSPSSPGPIRAEHASALRTRLRRTAVAVTIVALAATGLAACASPPGTAAAPSSAPAARMHTVSNHGHHLAFYVTAGHQPAIILDAGGGNDSTYWKKLVPSLSSRTGSEIITYDRAGMGNSQYVPGPFRGADAAADLAAGLTQLHVTHGAVLVAHSEAGEVATNLVDEYPGAGLRCSPRRRNPARVLHTGRDGENRGGGGTRGRRREEAGADQSRASARRRG